MASVLDGLRKNINKKYADIGVNVAEIGVSGDKFKSTFSLGSPALDFLTYNSIPEGIFIEIAGPEASGKTTLAFKIAADFIRKEKVKVEEERRHIMFVDSEGTADPSWAKVSAGYDMNDTDVETLYYAGLGQTAEQMLDDVVEATKSGKIGLVIFDSLVSIAGQQTAAASLEKKDMGGIAKILADFVKRSTGLFNRFRTTFIGINGIYLDPSGYGNPEKTPGGEYWKRACSLRLRTRRGKCFNEDGDELKDTDAGVVGHIINVGLIKTKFCRWDRKVGMCHLNYVKGLDILQDTIDLAILFGIITEPSKSYFVVTDPDTGEELTGKIHGQGNIKPYFEEHLDVWRRTYDKVYEKLSVKDDPNTISFEKMLNLDINEVMGINVAKAAEDEE